MNCRHTILTTIDSQHTKLLTTVTVPDLYSAMYRFYTKILLIVCNAVNGVSIKRKNKTYFISRRHTQTTADMCSAELSAYKTADD